MKFKIIRLMRLGDAHPLRKLCGLYAPRLLFYGQPYHFPKLYYGTKALAYIGSYVMWDKCIHM